MVNLFPIAKQQEYPVFGRFNARYGEALAKICANLKLFTIEIFTAEEYQPCPIGFTPMVVDDTSAFSYSYNKEENSDESIKAAVIINPGLIEKLSFTEDEQYAAIAHEIGHIIFRFSENKEQYQGLQSQEVYADSIACQIGLPEQMLGTLNKLEGSGLFLDTEHRFSMRKRVIKCIYLDDFNELL